MSEDRTGALENLDREWKRLGFNPWSQESQVEDIPFEFVPASRTPLGMSPEELRELYEQHPDRFWRLVRFEAETDPERLDYYAELDRSERVRREQKQRERAALLPPSSPNALTLDEALRRLESVRRTGPQKWQARCPAHEDKSPSLLIAESRVRPGEPYFHCFRGCDFRLIREALIGANIREQNVQ